MPREKITLDDFIRIHFDNFSSQAYIDAYVEWISQLADYDSCGIEGVEYSYIRPYLKPATRWVKDDE